MNRWNLNEKVKELYLPIIKEHIYKIENYNPEEEDLYEIELDLSDTPLNPYTLWKILEELGYEKIDQDENGWEMDFLIYFKKETCRGLIVRGCGMTFELILSGEEE